MATVDELLDEWDQDSVMDDNHISDESIRVPKLHAKYIRYLMQAKLKVTKYQNDFNVLKKTKFRYYRGELSREELIELNWSQWQNLKPLKTEMDQFLDGDTDLNNMKVKIEYLQTMVYLLESILGQIKGRDWQIRNIIEHKKFLAGS
ncbi:Recombination, repair and ssDNA binding protein UvsY [uncultured Caudovirales phage]|uniref:Recombination, repair and ssDNA binding protein UvsY n=1 Tax=uncultured Caudovirales phage TaxID=2100421 RepID=A0A6J5L1H4_9CAUD|nr:Recombination, repair and ssDNA binding protein UvsY [uncultured Caudovirales phage]